MIKLKKNRLNIIFLISVLTLLFFCIPNNNVKYKVETLKSAGWGSNADWHEGANQSTIEVDLTYEESIKLEQDSGMYMLEQTMGIHYRDGTYSDAGFCGRIRFNDGGIIGGVVVDWNKVNTSGISFTSVSSDGNQTVHSEYNFNGFEIFKGNSTDLALTNNSLVKGWAIAPDETKKIGEIDIRTKNYKIGEVNLSTNQVLLNGSLTTESIVEFDVVINATIGNSTNRYDVPVIYKFEVRHMINQTSYKYGIDIDWSGLEGFPTDLTMNYGDDYVLVGNDRLHVGGKGTMDFVLSTFSCNPENDTATFTYDNEFICQEHFTTAFKINRTGVDIDTKRYYSQYNNEDFFGNIGSRVFVFFDGFKYGKSTGFSFDPTVIIPCYYTPSEEDDQQIPFSNLFLVLFVISIVAVVIIVKKRKSIM
ncbi:MAG: hypothetical protein ACFE9I_15715 [Candidatus Hermodarchaeota archaeon]